MRDIDLKTLRLLVAVCDHQNMGRAAAQEHIEPSAISKRIAQLESDLGTPLLVRSRRGVQPTPAGLALLEHARTILFTMDRIASDVGSFSSGVKGRVRLVATVSAIAESLLDDIASFMREPANRNIKVDVEERFSHELVRHLREGSASVGVVWDHVDRQGLEHRPYRRDRLALAVHPDHPLAGRKSLRFEQTLDHEHVGLHPTSAVHIMLQRAAARLGRTVSYRVVVSNFDAAFRVVAANLGISVIPAEVCGAVATTLGIKVIPLTDAWAERRFAVCFRDYGALQPAARRLVDHLVERASAGEPVPAAGTS
jgi:DNA-binding transcriptional LysR family regulator